MQVVVLGDELLELFRARARESEGARAHSVDSHDEQEGTHLALDVGDLVVRERVLVERDLGGLEEAKEAELAREEEEEALALLAGASGAADTVDVVARVVGRVELDDPVNLGDVEAASGDVGAQEDAGRRVAELEERVGALLLLLLALFRREQTDGSAGCATFPSSERRA